MPRFVVTILSVAALSLAALPADAAPRNITAKSNAAGLRKQSICADYRAALDEAERKADARAGTPAAEPYAKEADFWYGLGEQAGCSWAK